MAEEKFFSLPNVFWFAAGAGLEVVFLGLGVSPTGMQWGTEVALQLGIIEPFSAAASSTAAGGIASAAPAAAAVASTGVEVAVL